jgi:uncharacterized SAM-binding protein YcdF (DUF218 family)
MFFFLSKTINFLTMPLVIICVLLLLSMVLRSPRWKYRLSRTGIGLLFFCSNDFIANEFLGAWEIPPTPFANITKRYQWGVLLSGVTQSGIEPKDRVYFNHGADRVTHTFQLYKEGFIKKIFVSGGNGSRLPSSQREADEIASVLLMMGTRPEDIITENKSRNTHESAIEVPARLAGIAGPEDCLLITSAFHMRRSAACFRHVGWTMDTFSTNFLSHPRKFSIDALFIPKPEALLGWHVLMKEWVGYLAYRLAGYL